MSSAYGVCLLSWAWWIDAKICIWFRFGRRHICVLYVIMRKGTVQHASTYGYGCLIKSFAPFRRVCVGCECSFFGETCNRAKRNRNEWIGIVCAHILSNATDGAGEDSQIFAISNEMMTIKVMREQLLELTNWMCCGDGQAIWIPHRQITINFQEKCSVFTGTHHSWFEKCQNEMPLSYSASE